MPGIVKGLFAKPEAPLQNFQPTGFQAPGLGGAFQKTGANTGRFDVVRGPAAAAGLRGLRTSLEGQAAEFRGLRPQVKAGFGALTKARVGSVENARQRTIGNLREELSKRRVLGSSFAQSTIASAEAEFAQQEGIARAEAFLGELGATQELISREYESRSQAFQAELSQANFESGIAAQLSASVMQAMERNAMARAELAAARESSTTEFLGDLAGFALGRFFPATTITKTLTG